MASLGTIEVDLIVLGQPKCCRELRKAGWTFAYDSETRFVSAEHPLGGKQSVVEVCRIGRTGFDVDEIGYKVAMLLNGGTSQSHQVKCKDCGGTGGDLDAKCMTCGGKG